MPTQQSDVTISLELPDQPDVLPLIEAAHAFGEDLYPPESNHYLGIQALKGPDIRFFVARRNGGAIGCGAIWLRPTVVVSGGFGPDGFGEVKQMYVDPAARGLGVARKLLAKIEAEARHSNLPILRLETGVYSHDALRLYRAAGFTDRGPFAEYSPDPMSVFMEKSL